MASVARLAAAIAAILVREGVDYAQSKTVFKAARQRAPQRSRELTLGCSMELTH